MTLENWLANKWLKKHETSAQEVSDLFTVVERDLKDAKVNSISADTRLSTAYNACLQCAAIALHASGYRPAGQSHHERIIESLRYTLNPSDDIIRQLQRFRNKRIKSVYDRAGTTSEQEVKEAIKLAQKLRGMVKEWLAQNHSDLIK